jgi:peptide chain release factor 2
MLLRMYTRYFDRNKYKYEELDLTPGEEAGIRSVTLKVCGPFAFGRLSCEMGVHRLVRISRSIRQNGGNEFYGGGCGARAGRFCD